MGQSGPETHRGKLLPVLRCHLRSFADASDPRWEGVGSGVRGGVDLAGV